MASTTWRAFLPSTCVTTTDIGHTVRWHNGRPFHHRKSSTHPPSESEAARSWAAWSTRDHADRNDHDGDGPDRDGELARLAVQVWAEALGNPGLGGRLAVAYRTLTARFADLAAAYQRRGDLRAGTAPTDIARVLTLIGPAYLLRRALIDATPLAKFRRWTPRASLPPPFQKEADRREVTIRLRH